MMYMGVNSFSLRKLVNNRAKQNLPDGAGRGTNYNKAGMRCEKREENGRETAWPQGNTACRGCVGR